MARSVHQRADAGRTAPPRPPDRPFRACADPRLRVNPHPSFRLPAALSCGSRGVRGGSRASGLGRLAHSSQERNATTC